MYDKKVFGILMKVFTTTSAALLLVAAAVFVYRGQMIKSSVMVTATIEGTHYDSQDGDRSYSQQGTDVRYEVDGKVYEGHLYYESSSFYVGKEIPVYYKAEKPEKLLPVYGTGLTSLVFAIVGGTFLIITLILFVAGRSGEKKVRFLKQEGRVIYAPVSRVEINRMMSVNRRHPYIIICQYKNPEDGKQYTFRSRGIWYDPAPYISNVTDMPVYVKRGNYKYYYMDADKYLPKQES
ncbi:MAG: hypothetical protein E7256_09585 [Lachnospiraceae bacterium]|nr:hypothetical protein [Lachnospiraceae bacterium]